MRRQSAAMVASDTTLSPSTSLFFLYFLVLCGDDENTAGGCSAPQQCPLEAVPIRCILFYADVRDLC